MGSPKLKVYLLEDGYAQTNDLDVQYSVGDELLPVVGKTQILNSSIEILQGIFPVEDQPALQFDLAGGRQSYDLLEPDIDHEYYRPDGVDFVDLLRGPVGVLQFHVMDADDVVLAASAYEIVTEADIPVGINFTGDPPEGPKVSAFLVSTTSGKWALPHDSVYDGTNAAFSRIVIKVDDDEPMSITAEGDDLEYITVEDTPTDVLVTMWYKTTKTRYFCGAHLNWVGDHLDMWPDVFIGLVDYPGDRDVDENGDPLPDEVKPGYVEVGLYQLNFRDGLVTFPDEVDTEELNEFEQPKLVRANYAYLAGIGNVTSQKLDPVDGHDGMWWQADTELVFPDSHGKRWIGRNDKYTPLNIYVQGELDDEPQLTPTPIKVLPWEQLTIKTSI